MILKIIIHLFLISALIFTFLDCTDLSTTLHREKRQAGGGPSQNPLNALPQLKAQIKAALTSPISRFEGKHCFTIKDANGNTLDTFSELKSSPAKARQYLIDLNMRMYDDGILPKTRGHHLDIWLKNIQNKDLTIIEDFPKLKMDVLKKWQKNPTISQFETTDAYKVTTISFVPKDLGDVEIFAQKLKINLHIGVDDNGNPKHLVPFDRALLNNGISLGVVFSKKELQSIGEETAEFWKKCGFNRKDMGAVLNDQDPLYIQQRVDIDNELKSKLRPLPGKTDNSGESLTSIEQVDGVCHHSGKRKRATGSGRSGCAVMINGNGAVESIDPEEFVKVYKNGNTKAQQELAEIVRQNPHRVIDSMAGTTDGSGLSTIEKMQKLVELEQVKNHVSTMNVVNQVESIGQSNKQTVGNEVTAVARPKAPSVMEGMTEKLSTLKNKVKLSHSKISEKMSSLGKSKGATKFSTATGYASAALGGYFTVKTLVTGIMHGDTTSLAIVGATAGYDAVTTTAVWAGTKYLAEASKWGKATKYLGKVAGPIGAVADIGLSVWSMTKSVQRLQNATNVYERDAAIADIVSGSIDIAVTATVTVLSLAFPPFAPIFISVGAIINLVTKFVTAIFQTANEVARIHAEIPLSAEEKQYVFKSRFMDWFGTRQPDYIDDLMEEKKANNLIVKHTLEFLENNTQILGIVIPSRTLHYDGGCHLTKRRCQLKHALGCTTWAEKEQLVGTGCDSGGPCSGEWGICSNHWINRGHGLNHVLEYIDFKCKCNRKADTSFGFPRSNSVVNLQHKKSVYWERAVPSDVEKGVFLCKPGTLDYVDFKVSQKSRRDEYLCKNAIGLMQPQSRRHSAQIMLFDLDDGNDTVTLSSTDITPNLFRMGEQGHKEFYGGETAKNEFIFDSNCSKPLTGLIAGGGREDDRITLRESCGRDKKITMNFEQGTMISDRSDLKLSVRKVEEFIGRIDQQDEVHVHCSTRKVITGGGGNDKEDLVKIPNTPCSYNLTVFAAPYTKVISEASNGDVIIALDGQPWPKISLDLAVYSKKMLRMNVMFLNTSANQIASFHMNLMSKNEAQLNLLARSNDNVKVTLRKRLAAGEENGLIFYFTEEPKGSPYSAMFLTRDNENTVAFYHSLPRLNSAGTVQTRYGCNALDNIFDIDGQWSVIGGDQTDEFILRSPYVKSIDGRAGVDTLKFHETFTYWGFMVDLRTQKFKNLENVQGIRGVPIIVKTSCETEIVSTQGGSMSMPDTVTVPYGNCPRRDTKIVVEGHTRVVMEKGGNEKDSKGEDDWVYVVAQVKPESTLKFELETKLPEFGNLIVAIITNHRDWTVVETKRQRVTQSVFLHLEGRHSSGSKDKEWMKLQLKEKENGGTSQEHYLKAPLMRMSVSNSSDIPGVLVIERESLTPKMIYEVRDDSEESSEEEGLSTVRGLNGLQNIFLLPMTKAWIATGGHKDDTFVVSPKRNQGGSYTIDGGNAGVNSLVIEQSGKMDSAELDSTFTINMATKKFGYLKASTSGGEGTVENVHQVVGRHHAPDLIYPACDTTTVNGRGGRSTEEKDIVLINNQNGCSFDLMVQMDSFTKVISNATTGKFTYYVEDLTTCSIDIQPTLENIHWINFAFHPWNYLTDVQFDKTRHLMTWTLFDGQTRTFKLLKSLNLEEANTNPVFEFHPLESQVFSDIRVDEDGHTIATFVVMGVNNPNLIEGVPVDVNKFLVNITATSTPKRGPTGSILGFKNGTSASQFWIINLHDTLELIDGGPCQDPRRCYSNSLHFGETFLKKVLVNLDINNGTMTEDNGNVLISHLRNIHELHGTRDTTAYSTCDTKQVRNVGNVEVGVNKDCKMELIIGLQSYTKVWFREEENEGTELNNITQLSGVIHYRFASPMSFEPYGSYPAMSTYSHVYYLPFDLSSLDMLRFDVDDDRLFYALDDMVYNHSMLSVPGCYDPFYPEPSMITEDRYRLQVGRDGSLWATLGDVDTLDSGVVEELQETANRLGVSILIQGYTDFYYIGHHPSDTAPDRNVLQTLANFRNHFGGGGAEDTMYDISHLNKNVFIYTGYTEHTFEAWSDNVKNRSKQTIDLTDIVVPIRQRSGTKYVPKINVDEESNLIISMEGYETSFPGKVIIVNGSNLWVAERVQLLLNNAMMDLVANPVPTNEDLNDEKRSNERNRRAVEQNLGNRKDWIIHPRPVIVPNDVAVFSISPEDLEDGQDIQFENASNEDDSIDVTEFADDNTTENPIKISQQKPKPEFLLARNGSDILFTNVHQTHGANLKEMATTVVLSGFFPSKNDMENSEEEQTEIKNGGSPSLLKTTLEVTIHVPGLNLMLNDSNIINVTSRDQQTTQTQHAPLVEYEIIEWKQVLHDAENILLKDMPEIPRTYWCEECLPWWKRKITLATVGGVGLALLLVAIAVVFLRWWNRIHRGYHVVDATKKGYDDGTEMKDVKLLTQKKHRQSMWINEN